MSTIQVPQQPFITEMAELVITALETHELSRGAEIRARPGYMAEADHGEITWVIAKLKVDTNTQNLTLDLVHDGMEIGFWLDPMHRHQHVNLLIRSRLWLNEPFCPLKIYSYPLAIDPSEPKEVKVELAKRLASSVLVAQRMTRLLRAGHPDLVRKIDDGRAIAQRYLTLLANKVSSVMELIAEEGYLGESKLLNKRLTMKFKRMDDSEVALLQRLLDVHIEWRGAELDELKDICDELNIDHHKQRLAKWMFTKNEVMLELNKVIVFNQDRPFIWYFMEDLFDRTMLLNCRWLLP